MLAEVTFNMEGDARLSVEAMAQPCRNKKTRGARHLRSK
ncbi:hypothetical protein E24_00294 [Faustovirus]|nr:hypothetical protein E24_00294 [Faustovirus]AMN84196.1 hypothetical protein D5a_00292 [Faustovirus]AMN85185.1 hypothetical protein E23_00293 [Faustovirus]